MKRFRDPERLTWPLFWGMVGLLLGGTATAYWRAPATGSTCIWHQNSCPYGGPGGETIRIEAGDAWLRAAEGELPHVPADQSPF